MSRAMKGKITIRGELVAETPISVGSADAGDQVDLDVAIDGSGAYYIPGTSLAGPMRAWLEKRVTKEIIRNLFGFTEQNDGAASPLFIEDGRIRTTNARERRHGVSIEDHTGVAKEGFFYTRALLPKGTRCRFEMELDITPGLTCEISALGLLIEALINGDILFGACKTRGFGNMKLMDAKVNYYEFSCATELDAWLNGLNASQKGLDVFKLFPPCEASKPHSHKIEIEWKPCSPLMVKSGRDGIEADMLPLMTGCANGLTPVIPGSSLKGALRAQANKILLTLFAADDPSLEPSAAKHPSLGLVRELFGTTDNVGRLSFQDVYCQLKDPVSYKDWLGEKEETLNTFSVKGQHVAIDRFTGGASDGALYNARPVKKELCWDCIKMALDVSRGLDERQKNIVFAFIKLLLRDFKDGYVPVGFGSRRGLGEITCESIVFHDAPSDEILQSAWDHFIATEGVFQAPNAEALKGE